MNRPKNALDVPLLEKASIVIADLILVPHVPVVVRAVRVLRNVIRLVQ
jgi:hypothetical protein